MGLMGPETRRGIAMGTWNWAPQDLPALDQSASQAWGIARPPAGGGGPSPRENRPNAPRFNQPGDQASGVARDTGSRPAHCNRAGHWRTRP